MLNCGEKVAAREPEFYSATPFGPGGDFRFRVALRRDFPANWMAWAWMMAAIKPGNLPWISAQREVLCISTPRRSPRINPASRSALKCWERVDFGMAFSLT